MSEMAPEPDPITKVARDLTEIEALHAQLPDQATNDSNAQLMPGGRAMVALAPIANLERWQHMTETSERLGRAYTIPDLEDDDDHAPATQLVTYWAETFRRHHGAEYGNRATLATETNFIRYQLPWAWDNLDDTEWVAFTADINRARRNLEDILFAGTRADRTRIVCDEPHDRPQRLLVLLGSSEDGSEDAWKCPLAGCKKRFDRDGIGRAHAKMLRSEGAERWLRQVDAIGQLKMQGRSEQVVRRWLAAGEGEGYCDPATHEVWVWWPSLWRKHLMTPTRKRGTA